VFLGGPQFFTFFLHLLGHLNNASHLIVNSQETLKIIHTFTPQVSSICIDRFRLDYIHFLFNISDAISSVEGLPKLLHIKIWIHIHSAMCSWLEAVNQALVERLKDGGDVGGERQLQHTETGVSHGGQEHCL
jgi:hypothetical protein